MQLAIPGTLMLFLENLNLEVLVLMAGLYKDANVLAAQVILVALGQVLMTFPYGLSLASGVTVGHSVGGNRPSDAVANCKMTVWINAALALIIILVMLYVEEGLLSIYTANNTEVKELTKSAYMTIMLAFFFDASQCNLGGSIKAVGKQGYGSLFSLCCMFLIALPVSYVASFKLGHGLAGLWIGYGSSAFCLTMLYSTILINLDWS